MRSSFASLGCAELRIAAAKRFSLALNRRADGWRIQSLGHFQGFKRAVDDR